VRGVLCVVTSTRLSGTTRRGVLLGSSPTLPDVVGSGPAVLDAGARARVVERLRQQGRVGRPALRVASPRRRRPGAGLLTSVLSALVVAGAVSFAIVRLLGPADEMFVEPARTPTCADLGQRFPDGVARRGATDRVAARETATADFVVRPKVYRRHRTLDTDRDGIVCEPGQ
jgi:hypothetical protein